MRPFLRPHLQGLSSLREHVYLRNGIYYFRIDIPSDLAHYFPVTEIKQSLKTRDPDAAKIAANRLELSALRAYTLLRLGTLPNDMTKEVVNAVIPNTYKPVKVKVKAPKVYRLNEVVKTYTAEKQSGWTNKTKMEVAGVFRMLVELLGNVDVTTIDRPKLVELRSDLLKVPPGFYVKNRNGSVRDAVKKATGPGLSIKTVNKHMARIGSLLKYCHELGYITHNPATGLQLAEKQRADEERSVYSLDDVKKIVGNLPLDPECPERYWIPLVGLYSGLRLNEICQLHIEDVVRIDDCWCLDINGLGNKRLKNSASERVIPVHPKLIELGFIKYYEDKKAKGHPRVWMNLTYLDLHGYTNSIGNWYRRFNREYVTDDPKRVFHSMRHTVADTLKQKSVSESAIAELLGHAHASITTSRYGKRYRPKVLLDALEQLDYGVTIPEWKI